MADANPGIAKRFAFLGNELPCVTMRRKCELEHAEGVCIAYLAVWRCEAQRVVAPAPRAYHDLANPVFWIRMAVRILRSEPLVGVLVSNDHEVGVCCIQVPPELPQFGVNRMPRENAAAE